VHPNTKTDSYYFITDNIEIYNQLKEAEDKGATQKAITNELEEKLAQLENANKDLNQKLQVGVTKGNAIIL